MSKPLFKKIALSLVWLFVVVTTFTIVQMTKTSAINACTSGSFAGRSTCHTYYNNINVNSYPNSPVLRAWIAAFNPPHHCNVTTCSTQDSLDNAQSFIVFVRTRLNTCHNPYTQAQGGSQVCPGTNRNCPAFGNVSAQNCDLMVVAGNSVIVNTMLGVNPNSFSNCPGHPSKLECGIRYAQSNFNRWAGLVNNYAQNNRINWYITLTAQDIRNNCGGGSTDTLAWMAPFYVDVEAYCNDPPPDFYMTFNNEDGSTFRIRLNCGNIAGPIGPLRTIRTNAPTLTISNITCSSTTFTITSRDPDGGPYNVTWRLNGRGAPNTVGGFGSTSRTVTINTPAYNANTTNYIEATTAGFGGGGSATARSNTWGPCSTGFSISTSTDAKLDDPENPNRISFTNTVSTNINVTPPNQVNNVSVRIDYYVADSTGRQVALLGSQISGSRNLINGDTNLSTSRAILIAYKQAGYRFCQRTRISPQSGTVNPSGNIITSSGTPIDDLKCDFIVDEPYAKFLGNDVYSGGGFGSSGCANSGKIFGFTRKIGSDYVGASVQFAAYAMGQNFGFPTASMNSSATAPAGVGLSFSNQSGNSPGLGLFGGNFGGSNCVHNYYADSNGATPKGNSSNFTIPTSLGSGKYSFNPAGGTLRLNTAAGTFAGGEHIFIYVNGNVYIPSNIVYASTTWSSEKQIPVLSVVASGNIYVDPNVTILNGMYVAQGGAFVTCANASGQFNQTTSANKYLPGPPDGDCHRNTLTVVGAVLANKIKLLRTKNSLRKSVADEVATNNLASEYFVFSPELYMANVCDAGVCSQSQTDDAIISLPPVL